MCPRSVSQSGCRGQETRRECNENGNKIRKGGGGEHIYGSSWVPGTLPSALLVLLHLSLVTTLLFFLIL